MFGANGLPTDRIEDADESDKRCTNRPVASRDGKLVAKLGGERRAVEFVEAGNIAMAAQESLRGPAHCVDNLALEQDEAALLSKNHVDRLSALATGIADREAEPDRAGNRAKDRVILDLAARPGRAASRGNCAHLDRDATGNALCPAPIDAARDDDLIFTDVRDGKRKIWQPGDANELICTPGKARPIGSASTSGKPNSAATMIGITPFTVPISP